MPTEIFSTDTDSGVISVARKNGKGYERVAEIPIGNAPRGAVKFTKDGRGFVSNCAGDTISEIDVLNHRETARIKVGPAPRGLAIVPGDRYALVSNSGANTISIVDLNARREVAAVATGRDPRHMAISPDGKFAYVSVWGSHYIAKLDVSALSDAHDTTAPLKVKEVARIPVGSNRHPYSVAFRPSTSELYVANTRSKSLTIIDTASDQIANDIELGSVGARATAFSPDGSLAFVSIENTSEVAVIDTQAARVASLIPVGPGPRGLAFDAKDMTIYVTAFDRTKDKPQGGGIAALINPPENSLTVVSLAPAMSLFTAANAEVSAQKLESAGVAYDFVPVAHGSCSVSILDTDALEVKAC